MTARALALQALTQWRQGNQFADAIIQRSFVGTELNAPDRAFVVELFYGVLRNLSLLDFWIELLRRNALDHASRDLLRLGLYQLFCLRTPGHAAVFETVNLSGRRSRGLINGVLRSAVRREGELRKAAEDAPLSIRWSHPEFLLERWARAYGEEAADALCAWNNRAAPIYARMNKLRTSVDNFLSAHPTAERLARRDDFVLLDRIPSDALAQGQCYIQDPSTAVACELLDAQSGETVLDACAAPGGKSGLIGQMMAGRGELVSCDRDPKRVARLQENLKRLGVAATVVQHDWRAALLVQAFDRILVDAPCTNTGVIRRRVDVRWRLTSDDFQRMQKEQLAIIQAVVPLLKVGGVLVYSTCSLEAEENEEVVQQALAQFSFLQLETQRAVLPFRDGFDGAFAAKMIRAL